MSPPKSLGTFAIEYEKAARPVRAAITGLHGVGKSTFAASAPSPIFIQTEDGADAIGVPRLPLCRSWQDVLDQIGALVAEDHDFRTAVVDTVDWAERLIHQYVGAKHLVSSISDIPYGRGYKQAEELLREALEGLDLLRADKGMAIVMLAHVKVKRFEDPTTDPYDRYVPDMHDSAAALICEWADVVGFMNFEIITRATDAGFGRKTIRGIGSGARLMHLEERPGFIAKNRYGMPASLTIPRDGGWRVFNDALTSYHQQKD
jgi:AAA domain